MSIGGVTKERDPWNPGLGFEGVRNPAWHSALLAACGAMAPLCPSRVKLRRLMLSFLGWTFFPFETCLLILTEVLT